MKVRQLIITLLLLCSATVRAQFHSVDWNSLRGDSSLPVCTQVVELPADYKNYSYSAHIEYPEFQRMSDAEVARFSLAERLYILSPRKPFVNTFYKLFCTFFTISAPLYTLRRAFLCLHGLNALYVGFIWRFVRFGLYGVW